MIINEKNFEQQIDDKNEQKYGIFFALKKSYEEENFDLLKKIFKKYKLLKKSMNIEIWNSLNLSSVLIDLGFNKKYKNIKFLQHNSLSIINYLTFTDDNVIKSFLDNEILSIIYEKIVDTSIFNTNYSFILSILSNLIQNEDALNNLVTNVHLTVFSKFCDKNTACDTIRPLANIVSSYFYIDNSHEMLLLCFPYATYFLEFLINDFNHVNIFGENVLLLLRSITISLDILESLTKEIPSLYSLLFDLINKGDDYIKIEAIKYLRSIVIISDSRNLCTIFSQFNIRLLIDILCSSSASECLKVAILRFLRRSLEKSKPFVDYIISTDVLPILTSIDINSLSFAHLTEMAYISLVLFNETNSYDFFVEINLQKYLFSGASSPIVELAKLCFDTILFLMIHSQRFFEHCISTGELSTIIGNNDDPELRNQLSKML